jgi:hypothetical protein
MLELRDRIATAAQLSSYQVPNAIPLLDVIRVLNRAKVSFVLAGAHALAAWTQKPRATQDVDVVVAARHLKKAAKALLAAFPNLETVDLPVVTRLRDRGTQEVAIDLMKPVQPPYCDVFKHTHPVTLEGEHYRIPSLEMALIMKFSAMTSLYRADADKYQDAADFIRMAQANADLNTDELAALASLIYPDGGKDVLEMVRKARTGEKILL